jgi:tetratricopeptide (TPR) repeat protein
MPTFRSLVPALLAGATGCAAGASSPAKPPPGPPPVSAIGEPTLDAAAPVVAREHAQRGEFEPAAAILQFAIERAREREDTGAEADLQAELGGVYISQMIFRGDRPPEASTALRRAQELAQASGRRVALAKAIDGEGMLLYWRKILAGEGEWVPIVDLFRRALAIREELQDREGMSTSIFHIGLTEQFRGQHEAAGRSFERALELARQTGDPVLASYPVRHLGYLAELRGDLPAALKLQEECLRLRQRGGQLTGSIHALIAVGDLRSKIDPRDPQAIEALEQALHLAEKLEHGAGRRNAEGTLGAAHVRRKEPDRAIAHLDRALTMAEADSDRLGAAEFLVTLAEAHAALGHRDQATTHLARAHTLAVELDSVELRTAVGRVARQHSLRLPARLERPK